MNSTERLACALIPPLRQPKPETADRGAVRLLTRNKKEISTNYPELASALAAQAAIDFIVDGEIVAFDGGRTSFARLQRRMQEAHPEPDLLRSVRVYFYLFDVMHVGEHDVRGLPLRDRKTLLRKLVSFDDPLRLTPHRNRGKKGIEKKGIFLSSLLYFLYGCQSS